MGFRRLDRGDIPRLPRFFPFPRVVAGPEARRPRGGNASPVAGGRVPRTTRTGARRRKRVTPPSRWQQVVEDAGFATERPCFCWVQRLLSVNMFRFDAVGGAYDLWAANYNNPEQGPMPARLMDKLETLWDSGFG